MSGPAPGKSMIRNCLCGTLLIKLRMPQTWTCDACAWLNPGGLLCERCGQALHYQLDPPADLPRRPAAASLPQFWSLLFHLLVAVLGALLLLPFLADRLGISSWWVILHLIIFGGAAISSLNRLMFRLWFHRLELAAPAHVRSGQMLEVKVTAAPFETIRGVRVNLQLREVSFNSQGQLRSRTAAGVQLNAGSPLRGRRQHVFEWDFAAPVPAGRYLNLSSEMRVSFLRAAGRFVPGLGLAAADLKDEGGWFIRLRVRRGVFMKTIKQRVLLYDPRDTLLVG